ncbi:MAG: GyrI-like domain-containing protein [Ferruginibacter sp.]
MKNLFTSILWLFCASVSFIQLSCADDASKKDKPNSPSKDTGTKTKTVVEATKKAPIINITDTLTTPATIVYLKDSAANTDRIGLKLAQIYAVKLPAFLKKNKLKMTGAPMAWYKSQKAPFFFEAGCPVDKAPKKLTPGIYTKQIKKDSALVAHFYGPYELNAQAYDILGEMLKTRKRKLAGAPFEVYIEDPMDKDGKMKDPYKVLTDIIFPYK